ncbi:MAG TPA: hypothetical protein VH394_29025 [Thermoanaerobaculia bacterium]|jgi:hypothetical protein|nr:hypothetical protein [Thermoanaerobaculia bacterium]
MPCGSIHQGRWGQKLLVAIPVLALLGTLPLNAIVVGGCAQEYESPDAALRRCVVVGRAVEMAGTKILGQASTAAASDVSGSRVSDSLADLLPMLQGAISPVDTSGNGSPVVLNFNSPPIFGGKTSLQTTLIEPKIFAPIEEKFADATRDVESKTLLDRAGGFGDATYSLGWAPVRRARNWGARRQQLFGRDIETYLPLIDEYAQDVLIPKLNAKANNFFTTARNGLSSSATAADLAAKLGKTPNEIFGMSFADLRTAAAATADPDGAEDLVDKLKGEIEDFAADDTDDEEILDQQQELSDQFAALIGNQPVLQVRTSYRDADPAVGPRDFGVTVEYSAGTLNFNRLLDEYRGLIKQWPDTSGPIDDATRRRFKEQAFNRIAKRSAEGDLWRTSYAITYKKVDDYDEDFEYDVDDVKKTFNVTAPGVDQWQVRINYSQLAGPSDLLASEARPRLEFSVEGIWNKEDDDVAEDLRRNDRVLGRITYTVPTTDNMTFPISIVYANRPEFLMEDKDLKNKLSMHVGLSYKLPRPGAIREKKDEGDQ